MYKDGEKVICKKSFKFTIRNVNKGEEFIYQGFSRLWQLYRFITVNKISFYLPESKLKYFETVHDRRKRIIEKI